MARELPESMRSHHNLYQEKWSNLKSRWESLLQPFQVEQEVGQKVFLDLVKAYSSAGRYYHTLAHIQQILATINSLRSLSQNYAAIEFAAWFHDVIYDSKANDNEEKSAGYAAGILRLIGVPSETIAAVYSLILNTKNHQYSDDIDSLILLDADLSILGASDSAYRQYARAIMKEYSWMSDEKYRAGRKQVLQSFLIRERIYHNDKMFAILESKARQNIQKELESL